MRRQHNCFFFILYTIAVPSVAARLRGSRLFIHPVKREEAQSKQLKNQRHTMKPILTTLLSLALAGSVFAGSTYVSTSSGKGVVSPPPPQACFGPGFSLGIFGGGFLPTHRADDYDSCFGGGALAEYFFDEHFGIQVSYGAFATGGTQHVLTGDLVVRFPLNDSCVAPYILLGGGGLLDHGNRGLWNAGAGVEFKLDRGEGMSIFADGTYNWTGESRDHDFTLVRVGVKWHL